MNITHSLNGHPNTGRQAEIILEREKKNREKTPELLLIIYKNIAKGTRAFRTLIECFDSINNPCPIECCEKYKSFKLKIPQPDPDGVTALISEQFLEL